MATWSTTGPVGLVLDIGVGDVQIAASDRDDAVVEVTPSNPARRADVDAARTTTADFVNGTLSVASPRKWTRHMLGPRSGSVDVRIEIPARSRVRVDVGMGSVTCTGVVDECHVKTGFGEIVIGEAGPVTARSGAGNIRVRRTAGRTDVSTGSGQIDIERLGGDGVVRSSMGDIRIGSVDAGPDDDLLVRSAAGRIDVERSAARLEAKTSAGDVRVGAVTAGAVTARTAFGTVDIGVANAVAAWLDLQTRFGAVRNALDDAAPPASGDASVAVTARTSFGDITIRRADTTTAGAQRGTRP